MSDMAYSYPRYRSKDSLLLIVLVISLILLLSALAIMYIPDMITSP
ncbi:MAG: hypothetical protein K9W43_12075 [Candidatus Thorarchaeota archaeon]|nr:hypothetical protein [Candidatus Thorarchaeota archaeon]